MTQVNNDFNNDIPPIICSCFIDGKMVGHVDNPDSLLDIFDKYLEKDFDNTKKDFKKKHIMLYFSIVNCDHVGPAIYTESDFENREEVHDMYDLVIEQFAESLNLDSIPSEFDSENYDFSEENE